IDYASLASQKADILVTHEAPSCHPHGFPTIDQLARSMDVGWSFHGHHHDNYEYQKSWESLGFNACGVGLRNLAMFNGTQGALTSF
ncbi:MAG: metallophosphoesterase, partial [Undibacterium sp.]|nr:metallophosphoesterase [Undibacterium sp.]